MDRNHRFANRLGVTSAIAFFAAGSFLPTGAQAQDAASGTAAQIPETGQSNGQSDSVLDEIVVTAQKKGRAERLQDVPIAITALGPAQIGDLHAASIDQIGASVPNVSFTPTGTLRGVSSFSIRGLASTSSVPSVEPAVGMFVDGVYLGTNYGVTLDGLFDIEGLEVLRGPQGTLQGRNVTGGAVMVRTARPGYDLEVHGLASAETGLQRTLGLSVGGPIAGDTVRLKVAGYYRHDDGWFHNDFTGKRAGRDSLFFVRPTLVLDLTDTIEQTFIVERGRERGDGVVVQNYLNPALRRFGLNYNEPGYSRNDWFSATSETNIHVDLGNGVITNILNYRKVKSDGLTDADGSPQTIFHLYTYLDQHQLSNELRYAGTFGKLDLTAGVFAFRQEFDYIERRVLAGGVDRAFGGSIVNPSIGVFAQGEYEIVPSLSLIAGTRYSIDHKEAVIHRSPRAGEQSNCSYATKTCNGTFLPIFTDEHSWRKATPKLGLNWKVAPDALLYASWSEGVRNGGYNVRSSSSTVPPGPYDEETQSALETGFKTDLLDRRLRINVAGFINNMKALQRDVIELPPPGSGDTSAATVSRNVADGRFIGFEGEVTVIPVRALQLGAAVGYTDGKLKNIRADLTGDNVVGAADYALVPPRLARWSYNLSAEYSHELSVNATLRAHTNFTYRSRSFADDKNSLQNSARNLLTATLTLDLAEQGLELSIFGRNLLNDSNETSLAVTAGGATPRTARFPEEGRVLGLEARIHF